MRNRTKEAGGDWLLCATLHFAKPNEIHRSAPSNGGLSAQAKNAGQPPWTHGGWQPNFPRRPFLDRRIPEDTCRFWLHLDGVFWAKTEATSSTAQALVSQLRLQQRTACLFGLPTLVNPGVSNGSCRLVVRVEVRCCCLCFCHPRHHAVGRRSGTSRTQSQQKLKFLLANWGAAVLRLPAQPPGKTEQVGPTPQPLFSFVHGDTTSSAKNCVVCRREKLLSDTKIRLRLPLVSTGPQAMASMLSRR